MMKQIALLVLLMIFLIGCSSKPQVITKIETKLITIPNNYFLLTPIDTNRTIITNKDASLFMIDLYNGYTECLINLKAIKELNGASINK